jgi:hypothetical protein
MAQPCCVPCFEAHLLDFKPRLNTSSYVNVCFEPEEREVAALGLEVNMADQSVYPASTVRTVALTLLICL